MIFWKKKLIECCKCRKRYSFDDNLFYHLKEYILICPNCNLMHKVDIQLLGKEYEGLKKVDKLNLEAINIGSVPVDWDAGTGEVTTLINKNNPANASGTITSVEVWAYSNIVGASVGIFYYVGGVANFTSRDSEYIGNVDTGAKRTFSVNLTVQKDDYIGIYNGTQGQIMGFGTGYAGKWYKGGNHIDCIDTEFTFLSGDIISLYGTGATPPIGWPHKWNGVTIGKLNGAVITKWNGIA